MAKWVFPFRGVEVLGATTDSLSFRTLSLASQVEIPASPHPGGFGVMRKHHVHEGVDLYCEEGVPVFAAEAGCVVAIENFTGVEAGSPWWESTKAVLLEGQSGVIVYGEIEPAENLTVGAEVCAGECLGHVVRVLKKDKGRPRCMLHFELHVSGTLQTVEWACDAAKPGSLCDPTFRLLGAEVLPSE